MAMTLDVPYEFGECVMIDGDVSIRAVVTAVVFRPGTLLIEASWINNGVPQSERFEPFRLSRAA